MNNTAMDMGNMVQLVTFNYNPSRSLIRNSEVQKDVFLCMGPRSQGGPCVYLLSWLVSIV